MSNNANQPAFPKIKTTAKQDTYNGSGHQFSIPVVESSGGLTKREYFAAIAMQGLLASDNQFDDAEETAKLCINLADALLKQLSS